MEGKPAPKKGQAGKTKKKWKKKKWLHGAHAAYAATNRRKEGVQQD
jgi:hypothetical protein